MRTTLDIEDDVLQAAKEMAQREGSSAGRVISTLARRGLTASLNKKEVASISRGGVPLLPLREEVITEKHIQNLMDAEGV